MRYTYTVGEEMVTVVLEPDGEGYIAHVNGHTFAVQVEVREAGRLLLRIDGRALTAITARDGDVRYVAIDGCTYRLERMQRRRRRTGGAGAGPPGGLAASMPGQVLAVSVAVGDRVQRGDTLVVLEAMKMEQRITAPADGLVVAVPCQVGDVVERDQVLVEVEGDEE